ncbi:low molecular weight phosphatase family protein [Pedobacter sp. Leaf132]|uniref:arsenate-mycothiol transferase ArsC n=1 Tax=Pedobacter sp. Leaf132 TaxID=2876557 RepID=UPI001E40D997|nr:protein-tyrosine-phosphatase [Pedobacter sp. Leaf132]
MYDDIKTNIANILEMHISDERKEVLNSLTNYLQERVSSDSDVNINFICTHNSRRSHLAQIWAQVAASYYQVPKVVCYSGGTEATAMFPMVAETLMEMGFEIEKLAETNNPIYMIKYADNSLPIIGFSKTYEHPFNPVSGFVAIMTCSQADGGCPFIAGADKRVPIIFEDPKVSDGTPEQKQVYTERSFQIAAEIFYLFSKIKK